MKKEDFCNWVYTQLSSFIDEYNEYDGDMDFLLTRYSERIALVSSKLN